MPAAPTFEVIRAAVKLAHERRRSPGANISDLSRRAHVTRQAAYRALVLLRAHGLAGVAIVGERRGQPVDFIEGA